MLVCSAHVCVSVKICLTMLRCEQFVQVEEEAREEIEAWEKDHGRTFLVEGVPFVQYIERQWTTFREQKELEKQERVSKKTASNPPPPLLPQPPKNQRIPCRNRSY